MTCRRIWLSVWHNAGMKPALCTVGIAMAILAWTPVQAQNSDWSIESFRSEVVVHDDASITVNETIRTNFGLAKHGIFRNIPFRYQTDDGGTMQVPINDIAVRRNNQAEPYAVTTNGDEIEIKIGDADKTIIGPQTYTINYTAAAAVNFFDDHDELYWNVTGNNWEVEIQQVETVVRLDSAVSADQVQGRCLTGIVGSTAENCTTTVADSSASFAATDEFLTVAVGWPKNIVTKPDAYDAIRAGAGKSAIEKFIDIEIVWWTLNSIIPLLIIIWIIRRYLTHGRDPKGKGTVIAQYDPPIGLTPGEMGTLFDERAHHRDIVATIIDLAVRGFLTITEIKSKKALGLGISADYQLDRLPKKDATKLKPHEKKVLDGLFDSGDSVKLTELKGSFHTDLQAIRGSLYTQVRDQGYFYSNPNSIRISYVLGGLVLAGISIFGFVMLIFGPFIAGLIIAAFGPFMPKRTDKGAEALWHAKGFKLFLEKAEKYRLQWQEKEHIFETYLPYAMAFGVAEKWSKTFEGMKQTPPTWYHGAADSHFNSLLLWSALNNFSTTTVRSFAPPAASGGSGFGGGGMSGGGLGGGGGGSW